MGLRLSVEIYRLFSTYLNDFIVSIEPDNRSNVSDIDGNVEDIGENDKDEGSITDDNVW